MTIWSHCRGTPRSGSVGKVNTICGNKKRISFITNYAVSQGDFSILLSLPPFRPKFSSQPTALTHVLSVHYVQRVQNNGFYYTGMFAYFGL